MKEGRPGSLPAAPPFSCIPRRVSWRLAPNGGSHAETRRRGEKKEDKRRKEESFHIFFVIFSP
jgi:hypothetical protein